MVNLTVRFNVTAMPSIGRRIEHAFHHVSHEMEDTITMKFERTRSLFHYHYHFTFAGDKLMMELALIKMAAKEPNLNLVLPKFRDVCDPYMNTD